MSTTDFSTQMNGWLNGSASWSEMDDYAEMIGGDVNQSILPDAINLAVWLFGEDLEKWMK
jgi:hypothetical protein